MPPAQLKWIAEWVLAKAGWDPSKRALAIALRVEYMLRSSSAIKARARSTHAGAADAPACSRAAALAQAWRLTNKCSQCHCIGHNKQNHTHAFDAFLAGKGCEDAGFEMHDVVEGYNDNKTELDGWFEWL